MIHSRSWLWQELDPSVCPCRMILAVIKVGVQERCHVENLSRNAICCKEPMIIAGKERLYFCTLSSIHGIFSSALKVSKYVVKQQFKSQLNRQPWCMVWNLSKLKQLVVVTALKHVSTSQNYTNKSAKLKMQSICTSLLSKTNSPVYLYLGYRATLPPGTLQTFVWLCVLQMMFLTPIWTPVIQIYDSTSTFRTTKEVLP